MVGAAGAGAEPEQMIASPGERAPSEAYRHKAVHLTFSHDPSAGLFLPCGRHPCVRGVARLVLPRLPRPARPGLRAHARPAEVPRGPGELAVAVRGDAPAGGPLR